METSRLVSGLIDKCVESRADKSSHPILAEKYPHSFIPEIFRNEDVTWQLFAWIFIIYIYA